ncbi:MAG: helix-turn-helix transcriptional regulator [Acutalibacteraceae bacterium]|nr:helix-turn-helix transcriptional regulator [Acutalibacteraceae bacterium]
MKYYERIRILRESQDLSQKKLGDLLNLNQRTVSQYERNGRSLPIDVVIRYAQYFKVTTDYILGLSNNPQKGWLEGEK